MLTLRPAIPADALAVATVHVRSWQAGYRGLLADEYLDSLRADDRAKHYTFGSPDPDLPSTIVAEQHGRICGFASIGESRDLGPDTGELLALYVDPDAWGIGAGRALVQDARARMHARGLTNAVLWILDGNARAERFYRIDGWIANDVARRVTLWGIEILEHRFRRQLP
jgi:ribosomal protein S18 acetylase RimI-like enzyme